MAMSASDMATRVVNNIATSNPEVTGAARTRLIAEWTLVCQGIIDHLVASLDVLPASHGATPLENPTGQAIVGTVTGSGAPVTGATSVVSPIIGTGSVQ